jgi:dTMP kinase
MAAPRFITLEGGEGAGKSTQQQRLAARLTAEGIKTISTREPGGAAGAEAIRTLLVTGDLARWSPLGETLLHFAARQEHLTHTIRPALARGEWVICDRFIDSTFAYQGAAQGLAADTIATLGKMVVGATMPDLTLILDLPVEAGLARATTHGGEDRYERMGTNFHETLRQTFLDRAKAEPARCAIIDATGSEDDVAARIWQVVTDRHLL